jgi:hypothetical protein
MVVNGEWSMVNARQTYKVCGKGFVRKENLIAFVIEGQWRMVNGEW